MVVNDLIKGKRIILGSASPRRKELLGGLGFPFEVDAKNNAPEYVEKKTPHSKIPQSLARYKSIHFHRPLLKDEILITADTMVFCNRKIFGKPEDRNEAFSMLKFLSGKTHRVLTGVCIRDIDKESLFTSVSYVTFKELSDDEIDYYLDNYRPYDKAGSYGVQEWIGYVAITGIKGSYYNVMGLPIQALYLALEKFLTA